MPGLRVPRDEFAAEGSLDRGGVAADERPRPHSGVAGSVVSTLVTQGVDLAAGVVGGRAAGVVGPPAGLAALDPRGLG